ncbi:hypothetical protein [Streptomyces sp. NBC_01187]|uniref:hypothetical protein n=1 Tax=Streptomyces sp. NBC_01187 TaxID=2903766 RepID=UPI00386810EC|nr:hypothetical protein OG220_00020 [Streptomyces sp. NBC_01187]WSS46696.1 hypothetical protein OG220_39620 [Streptomyces sp. NBC_01187]
MSGWRARAGPWPTLPDGQELEVIVVFRERTSDGRWWFACEAILPTRYEHADRQSEAKAAPTRITVAADSITPIPGERYDAVPTKGADGSGWRCVLGVCGMRRRSGTCTGRTAGRPGATGRGGW